MQQIPNCEETLYLDTSPCHTTKKKGTRKIVCWIWKCKFVSTEASILISSVLIHRALLINTQFKSTLFFSASSAKNIFKLINATFYCVFVMKIIG